MSFSFNELLNDPAYRAMLYSEKGKSTYRLEKRGNDYGVDFMGKFYTDPTEYNRVKKLLKFKGSQRVTGNVLESLPVGSGHWRYGRLETLVKKVRERHPNFGITRSFFGVDADLKAFDDLRMVEDTLYGMVVPDDETITLLQMFKEPGQQMSGREIESLLAEHGVGIRNLLDDASPAEVKTYYSKLQKRMKALINIDQYHATQSAPYRTFFFSDYKGMYEKMNPGAFVGTNEQMETAVDGASFVTGEFVEGVKRSMQERADKIRGELKGNMHLLPRQEQDSLKRMLKSLDSDIEDLSRIAGQGGRLEGFRLGGFDRKYLADLNYSAEDIESFMASMIKGDVLVVRKKGQKAFLKRMAEATGVDIEKLRQAQVFAPVASLAKEAEMDLGVSFKIAHARAGVVPNQQLLSGYSRSLFGAGQEASFGGLIDYNKGVFKAALDNLRETGELPSGYLRHLEDVLDIDPSDPKKIEAILGSHKIPVEDVLSQQNRSRRILASLEMGLSPANDRTLFGDIASSMIDYMDKASAGKAMHDLGGFVPASFQGHVLTDMQAMQLGIINSPIKRGTIGFDKTYGMIYNASDFIDFGARIHGGADLDDLIASLLYWDQETDSLLGFIERSPQGLGEAAVMGIDEGSLEDIARTLTSRGRKHDLSIPQNIELRKRLDEIGFFEDSWAEQGAKGKQKILAALKEYVPTLTPEMKSQLKRTANVFGVDPTGMPSSINSVAMDEFRSFLDKAKAELDYIDSPDMIDLSDRFTADQISQFTKAQREAEEIFLKRFNTEHMLGKYSLVREMADELALTIDTLNGLDAKKTVGKIRPFEMEPIIDLLTQGVAEGYEGLELMDVEIATQKLLKSIAETVDIAHKQGVNILDPTRLSGDTARNLSNADDLRAHLSHLGYEGSLEDLFMGKESRAAVHAQSKMAQQQIHYGNIRAKEEMMSTIGDDPAFERTFFSDRAVEDADRMKAAYDDAFNLARKELTGEKTEADQMEKLGEVLIETSKKPFQQDFATAELRRAFASTFNDEGVMTKRGIEAMGAFMQRYGGTGAASAVRNSELSNAWIKSRANLMLQLGGDFTDRQMEAFRRSDALKITNAEILGGISHEATTPGLKAAAAKGEAYDLTEAILSGELARGPQAAKEIITTAWKSSSVLRKGTFGAAALLGASLLYRRTRDRTPEDMEGPPLLPGGSFYEDAPAQSQPNMDFGSRYTPSGGVNYKINARGSFSSGGFQSAVEEIVGTQASGATYKSRGRDNGGIFGAIREAF